MFRPRLRPLLWVGWLLSALALASPLCAEVIPLAVREGHAEWVFPANQGPCFLILGTLAPAHKNCRVHLQAESTTAAAHLPREAQGNQTAIDLVQISRQVDRLRKYRQTAETFPCLPEPPRKKTFYLFTAERDLENPSSYTPISADLRGVGKYVQVYVDTRDSITADLDLTITEVTQTFDQEIYPWSRQKLGQVVDVDRDGRFTILLSTWLQRLQGGKVSLDGFVRGSDFLRDLGAPFSNRCDMMYLNAHLKPGPHLRTVMAHEFTHAVTFCEHVLHNPTGYKQDEESWLSEGLAHLVEDLHQHGWTNLDYRVSAFLAQPERYPLVVPDYFGSGLWRTPGTRGSVYLFLRWCYVTAGPDLPRRLIQSPLGGIRNLEQATQKPFAELYREWAVSLVQEDSWRGDRPLPDRFARAIPPPARVLGGPKFTPLEPGRYDFALAGTCLKYFLVPTHDKNRRLRLQTDPDSNLQATLVRLHPQRGFLKVQGKIHPADQSLQLEVQAYGSSVRLEAIAWEKLVPPVSGREKTGQRDLTSYQLPLLVPGEKRLCTLPALFPGPRSHDVVIRVLAKEAEGRPVVGWTTLLAEDGVAWRK
jgi:hypothetical protein